MNKKIHLCNSCTEEFATCKHDKITVDDTVVPWLASQTDMLAEDWQIVN